MGTGTGGHWFYYADRDDPRLYAYKNPRAKWMGVTLNFARPGAWRHFLAILLVSISPCCLLFLAPWIGLEWAKTFFKAAMMAVIALIVVHCHRAAAKDWRRHGGRDKAG